MLIRYQMLTNFPNTFIAMLVVNLKYTDHHTKKLAVKYVELIRSKDFIIYSEAHQMSHGIVHNSLQKRTQATTKNKIPPNIHLI